MYFIKEFGETNIEGLVNFEKLRKLSKGVRSIVQMTASSFDLTSMRDVPTSHSIIFSMFGCTNPTLINEFRSHGYHHQFPKLRAPDHVKKLYEEAVMVRKVRHYLNNMAKNIEKNEERLRLISSTLEHSTSGNTLKRKPSPSSSLGGSLSSINALNSSNNLHNISNGSSIGGGTSTLAGISAGNGTLLNNNQKNAIFGAHSPDAVKKLLALSETKVKTVKNSTSSTSMPLASAATASATTHHMSNSRSMLSGSSTGMAHSNSSLLNGGAGGNISPATPLSPRAKMRSTSNSQPLKYNHNFSAIPLSQMKATAFPQESLTILTAIIIIKIMGAHRQIKV